jgi:hypothetical protein
MSVDASCREPRMILRFLRRGGGRREGRPAEVAERETYQGFVVLARPIREQGQWRLAGSICREGDEEGARHDFVRADTMADREECIRMSLLKGRQLVDEQGDRLLRGAD